MISSHLALFGGNEWALTTKPSSQRLPPHLPKYLSVGNTRFYYLRLDTLDSSRLVHGFTRQFRSAQQIDPRALELAIIAREASNLGSMSQEAHALWDCRTSPLFDARNHRGFRKREADIRWAPLQTHTTMGLDKYKCYPLFVL